MFLNIENVMESVTKLPGFIFSKGDELRQRAFNLSLAALLGNEVYNFGELVCKMCVLFHQFHLIY